MIASEDLVGCYLVIFAEKKLKKKIKDIKIESIKCGLYGSLGNKGAIIISFHIENMKICFINCHLPAGKKNIEDRIQALQDIHVKGLVKYLKYG